jgi:hypothetical protein
MSQDDLNSILDVSLSMGCDLLEKDGFFQPFAVTLEADGELQRSGELSEEEKKQDPEKNIAQIEATLSAGCRQGLHRAAAIGMDVKVQRFANEGYVKAIEVKIEHQDGLCFDCFLPYKVLGDGKLQYGSIFSTAFEGTMYKSSEAESH